MNATQTTGAALMIADDRREWRRGYLCVYLDGSPRLNIHEVPLVWLLLLFCVSVFRGGCYSVAPALLLVSFPLLVLLGGKESPTANASCHKSSLKKHTNANTPKEEEKEKF